MAIPTSSRMLPATIIDNYFAPPSDKKRERTPSPSLKKDERAPASPLAPIRAPQGRGASFLVPFCLLGNETPSPRTPGAIIGGTASPASTIRASVGECPSSPHTPGALVPGRGSASSVAARILPPRSPAVSLLRASLDDYPASPHTPGVEVGRGSATSAVTRTLFSRSPAASLLRVSEDDYPPSPHTPKALAGVVASASAKLLPPRPPSALEVARGGMAALSFFQRPEGLWREDKDKLLFGALPQRILEALPSVLTRDEIGRQLTAVHELVKRHMSAVKETSFVLFPRKKYPELLRSVFLTWESAIIIFNRRRKPGAKDAILKFSTDKKKLCWGIKFTLFKDEPIEKVLVASQLVKKGEPTEYEIVKALPPSPYILPIYAEAHKEGEKTKVIHAMKYCEGGDLFEVTETVPLDMRVMITSRAFHAVAYALRVMHNSDFIHGDIKAENIFCTKEGAFLGDFGMSSSIEDKPIPRGTIGYCSPAMFQIASRCKGVTRDCKADDLWALGVALLVAYSLKDPFGDANKEIAFRVRVAMLTQECVNETVDTLLCDLPLDPRIPPLVKRLLSVDQIVRPTIDVVCRELDAIFSPLP